MVHVHLVVQEIGVDVVVAHPAQVVAALVHHTHVHEQEVVPCRVGDVEAVEPRGGRAGGGEAQVLGPRGVLDLEVGGGCGGGRFGAATCGQGERGQQGRGLSHVALPC